MILCTSFWRVLIFIHLVDGSWIVTRHVNWLISLHSPNGCELKRCEVKNWNHEMCFLLFFSVQVVMRATTIRCDLFKRIKYKTVVRCYIRKFLSFSCLSTAAIFRFWFFQNNWKKKHKSLQFVSMRSNCIAINA